MLEETNHSDYYKGRAKPQTTSIQNGKIQLNATLEQSQQTAI